jgi:hypothetical protein
VQVCHALVVGRGSLAATMAEDLARMREIVVSAASGEDGAALERLLAEQHVLVSAAPPAEAAALLRRATLAKCLSADVEAPLPQALELDALLREKQLTACVGCRETARQLGYAGHDERAVALVTTALARRLLTGDFRPHWGAWTPGRVLQRTGMAHGIREDLRERGVSPV